MRNVESKRNRMEWNLDFYGKKMNASSQKKNSPCFLVLYTENIFQTLPSFNIGENKAVFTSVIVTQYSLFKFSSPTIL
jgi:hypothetical protein